LRCFARGFRCQTGEDSSTVISGLTITHGYAGAPEGFGGGTVQNCTCVGNMGQEPTSTVIFAYSAPIFLHNCVVAFNDASSVGHDVIGGSYPAYISARCSDIYGNAGGDWIDLLATSLGQEGNICEDPLFCDVGNWDLRLQPESPCAPFTPPNPQCDLIGSEPVGCRSGAEVRPLPLPSQPASHVSLSLLGATPNPFAHGTRIAFDVPGEAPGQCVVLRIFDVAGRRVRTLNDGPLPGGRHTLWWDATRDSGEGVGNGVYFCRLERGASACQRMIIKVW
jgi:hypothetical protein